MDEALTYEESVERVPYYSKRPAPLPVRVEPETRMRIKLWMGWCLVVTAVLIDLAEFGLTYISVGIGSFIMGFVGAGIFGFWFWTLRVTYSGNTKTFMTSILMHIGELLPLADGIVWPLWTVGMMIIITLTRMEDRGEEPTIFGALKRITAWGSIASGVGLVAVLNIKRQDTQRRSRRRLEREEEASEIAQNPDRIGEIRQKYTLREQKFKHKELGILEKTESKFFKIGKEGVSLREGKTREEAREAFGKVASEQKNNVLNLKKGPGGWSLPKPK